MKAHVRERKPNQQAIVLINFLVTHDRKFVVSNLNYSTLIINTGHYHFAIEIF